jgi:hypothetical protein
MKLHDFKVHPEFDLMVFMERSGGRRVNQAAMEAAEDYWKKWLEKVSAYKLVEGDADPGCDPGFLLTFLDQSVEADVDAEWQKDNDLGMLLHQLAIYLVTAAAVDAVPELYSEKGGAIPEAPFTPQALDAMKSTGFGLKQDSTPTHQYMIFTNHPYKGSCETCGHGDSCTVVTLGGEG